MEGIEMQNLKLCLDRIFVQRGDLNCQTSGCSETFSRKVQTNQLYFIYSQFHILIPRGVIL